MRSPMTHRLPHHAAHLGDALVLALVAAVTAVLLVAPAPAGAQSTIRADEFEGTALDTSVWTFVNPLGDSTVSVADGAARIAVAAGATHDVWGSVNTSVGLRQAA